MDTLSLALLAVKEGPGSSALSQLRERLSVRDRPYPYIIATDFDGTLCENHWPEIGRENRPVIEAVSLLRQMGALVVLWTCREGEDLEQALEWCEKHDLSFDAVNENCSCIVTYFDWDTRKVHADEYWDDRAVSVAFPSEKEA